MYEVSSTDATFFACKVSLNQLTVRNPGIYKNIFHKKYGAQQIEKRSSYLKC